LAKCKSEEISRRDFLEVSIGAAVVAGIGCSSGNDAKGQDSSSSGGASATAGGASGKGGAGATNSSAAPTENGGAATSNGGAATSSGGASSIEKGGAAAGGDAAAGGSEVSSATGGKSTAGGKSGSSAAGGTTTNGGRTSNGPGTGGNPATGGRIGTTGAGGTTTAGGKTGTTGTGGTTAAGGSSANVAGSPATGGVAGGGSGGTPLVALVRGTDWVQATMDAIALVGGLPDLSGKTVLLKPNIISSSADATTNKDVIHGVIKAVKAKNAGTIIVADSAWGSPRDVLAFMASLGIADICDAEGASMVDLQNTPHPTRNGTDFSDVVYNADFVINMPVCKSHSVAKFTLALKNWYGCTENGRPHASAWDAPAKLRQIKQEGFVVLDATKTMITGGPSSGTMVQSKIVVASKDAIAVDVTGLCIHKYSGGTLISSKGDAWKLPQIKSALALGLPGWLSSAQEFSYAQQGVTEHADIMALRGV
jgi:uncharacterized protein (DUF362 family)